jgi:hypothetical protein
MVKQEQGETLRKYMRRFFDKRAIVVDVSDKEVIDLFQDGLYHRRTFEDFGRRRPSSITHLEDMITSWADEEDKANAKYDAIRGKSKQKTGGGSSNNNGNQGCRNNNNYSGTNRKRKPDNTVAAIQCPAKENSKKTSGGFKDLLKEKCLWHLDGNHTTEQCYQLRRALKDTPKPQHPHGKKGKKKNDEGNGDFQEPNKTVNVLFGGLPSRRVQKATRREVMSIEPAVQTPLRWSEVPITFSRADQWTSFSEPGRFPLVLKPVVVGSKLNKVLIDGGSGLNVLFTKTLKNMKLDITHMLTKSTSPFYGIIPGNAAIPLGSVVLPSYLWGTSGQLPYRVHQIRSRGLRDILPCHPRQTVYRQVHGGTPLHLLGFQDAKSNGCTVTARGLEDFTRLRHRSCGDCLHKSSTQRYDGDLRCIKEACPQ